SKDYKRLYEREKEERERLQRELDRCNRQISQLRQEQQLRTSNDHSYSNTSDTMNIHNYTSSNNCNNSQIPDTEIIHCFHEIMFYILDELFIISYVIIIIFNLDYLLD
ncbi:unnamed protein product, partial [Schistosoma curassoni]|uniref:PRKG1_interact domain-containing protein n=1 Tax=Schistosoma curassoni TaxID=6186 RepID=A0A183JNZ9_9TREM